MTVSFFCLKNSPDTGKIFNCDSCGKPLNGNFFAHITTKDAPDGHCFDISCLKEQFIHCKKMGLESCCPLCHLIIANPDWILRFIRESKPKPPIHPIQHDHRDPLDQIRSLPASFHVPNDSPTLPPPPPIHQVESDDDDSLVEMPSQATTSSPRANSNCP